MSEVIAAGGALLGAAVGGLVTYLVARQQITASTSAERDRVRREDVLRRRELYADFLAATTQIATSWREYTTGVGSPEVEAARAIERVEYYDRLQPLISRVRLTASTPVAAAADELMGTLDAMQQIVRRAGSRGAMAAADWDVATDRFMDARNEFVAIIRARRATSDVEPDE